MDKLIFRVNKGRTDQTNMLRVYSTAYEAIKKIAEKNRAEQDGNMQRDDTLCGELCGDRG